MSPSCSRPATVQRLLFSSSKYPNIKAHTLAAIAQGWPRILVINRPGAAQRRDRLLEDSGLAPRADEDRDEYPPAVGRGRANGNQKGLVRGIKPLGWMADVMYVPDRENQSHGSSIRRASSRSGLARACRFEPTRCDLGATQVYIPSLACRRLRTALRSRHLALAQEYRPRSDAIQVSSPGMWRPERRNRRLLEPAVPLRWT